MPGWEVHMRWSKKMGISNDVAEYTNRVIDAKKLEDHPKNFLEYAYRKEFPRPKGKKPFSLTDFLVIFPAHDFRKLKKEVLPYFRIKGENYVKAWYLHHILDYLVKLKDWMKNTGESIEDCIDKYRKNKAVTILGTEKQLTEVMDFLQANTQELREDIL